MQSFINISLETPKLLLRIRKFKTEKAMSKLINNPNGDCRLCTDKNSKDNMVACDECDRWYHIRCAKLTRMPTAEETWICVKCMTNQEKWQKQGAAAEKQNASPSTK